MHLLPYCSSSDKSVRVCFFVDDDGRFCFCSVAITCLLHTGCLHANSSHWLRHHSMSESIKDVIIPDIR
jgi:hypothetical protein